MKSRKIVSFILLLTCMLCLGLSFGIKNTKTAKAQDPAETVAMDDKISISTWGEPETEPGITWMHMSLAGFTSPAVDWNSATAEQIAANNGVNPLDYVIISGKTASEHLAADSTAMTVHTYTGWAEVFVVKVNKTYLDLGAFTIQLKAGFTLAGTDGNVYVLQNDTKVYGWNNGAFGEYVEPVIPEIGTPDVEFVQIHNDNNNSVWGGTTRAVRIVFSQNFTAKAYDGNEGGFDAPVIADLRYFVKINGNPLGNLTFVQIDNENSITFLYDESLLAVPEGQEYTLLTIEAGAPFGGHYLPAVTLYFDGEVWSATEPVPEEPAEVIAMDDKIAISTWGLAEENSCVWMNMPFTGFTSPAVEWNGATEEQIANNNGVNPFDYVVINGKTAREHVAIDSTAMTLHTYTGWEEAFVVKVNPSYLGLGEFTFQLKAGFTLVGTDGNVYVLQNDTKVYGWNNGEFGEYVEPAEIVAMDDKIAIETWGIAEDKVWMHMPLTGFTSPAVEWNSATEEQIANNNGVSPLDYVIINGMTAREHIDADGTAMTLHTYTGWAEVFVVKVNPSYLALGEFTFQLKAGFTLAGTDGNLYVLQNDTKVYGWNNGSFGEYVEPVIPEKGTPDVEFVQIHNDNNNSVWGGATRAVRLVFSDNFNALAYDANEGGFDAPVIAELRNFVKINGNPLGDLTFVQIDNENSITFLYNENLLAVPEGQEFTLFTIEEGAPFGGHYLPAVTLYFDLDDGVWSATVPVPDPDPVTENVTVTNIHNRNGGGQKLLLFISNNDYTVGNFDITAKIANVNVLDYVYVYTSETEYVTLGEIYQDNATSFIWGEANSIAFAINETYHGTAVYAVEIKAGAQFPAATNNYTTYVTTEDIVYYNANYNSGEAALKDFAISWTTEKPVVPDEPEPPHVPTLGTPDVEFVEIHDENNIAWAGSETTRALRLVFSENFDAKAYDGNPGGYHDALIADIRSFTTINGQPIDDLTILQIDNENAITFLYSVGMLLVPSGQTQTVFHIEVGTPFGGRYLPEITLYFNGESWQTEETDVVEEILGIVDTQNNTAWGDTQKSVRIKLNYNFNNDTNYNINDADGLNLISKLTFDGVALTDADITVFTEDIRGNTFTILYNNDMLDWALEDGARYHTLSLTESVNYLGVNIPAFTMYLRKGVWTLELPELVVLEDVETAVGYKTTNLIHIRDWNLDQDDATIVNNMIIFFFPSGGFPAGENIFLNLDKVNEYNVFDKIKLHMITPNADADANGFVTLGQVFNAGGWYPSDLTGGKDQIVVVNIWETRNSIAFSMGAEYNAESFDYVIIEEGCEFPNYYYTNASDKVDYLQNGAYVEYGDLERASFIQTQTVKMFTNPADFRGPSINTNWGIDTNMGEITISGVDFQDGYVVLQLEDSNYPTEGDEHLNVSAGNAPMSLNMLAEIYVNGISLYDRVVNFGAPNGIKAFYNYNGYGNFAISVELLEGEVVNEIIVAKDLRVPIYGMSVLGSTAYGIMYTETVKTTSYTKGSTGFEADEEVYWTVTFDDGQNVTTIRVKDGEMLNAEDFPATPTKQGFEFVGWVHGIDGIYSFDATSPIKSGYYLTTSWTEKTESVESSTNNESQASKGGCSGSIATIDMMATLLLVASGMLFIKRKRA